ncbi:hypothetical protein J437_LFUL018728 [Ladona fulva]|uniref:Reverse transcriptase n=1 Tax=Ladona fulva TaxID=123851 RepID=A0A8K0KPW7_LADFU|nr:hypothetical protein J437_LFUL018728 [Ladona fulva]
MEVASADLEGTFPDPLERIPEENHAEEIETRSEIRLTGLTEHQSREEEHRPEPYDPRGEFELWKDDVLQQALDLLSPRGGAGERIMSAIDRDLAGTLLGQSQSRVPEYIDNLITDWITPALAPETEANKEGNAKQEHGRRGPSNTKQASAAKSKRFYYGRCQGMYENCPKKLARLVIEDDLNQLQKAVPREGRPTPGAIKAFYEEFWRDESGSLKLLPAAPMPISKGFSHITPKEVRGRIRKVKNRSAAGIDGITKQDLRSLPEIDIVLAKLFNLLLVTGYFPAEWRKNRTTLIPKGEKTPVKSNT